MKRAAIVWDEVREQIRKNEEALRETLSEGPERIQTAFRQRAIQLAKADVRDEPASKGIPALVFRLGQERYAIALGELSEVVPFRGCAAVPGTGPELLGVMNLRGEIRPVIDLGRVLKGSHSSDPGAVLVLRRPAALKVDAVEDLREISAAELGPARAHYSGQHIRALASGALGWLDVESLLPAVLPAKESRSL